MSAADVSAVSRHIAKAVLDDGEQLAITNWFDEDGDECDPDEAVACVAGPDRDGHWWAIDLIETDPVTVN